MSQTLIGKSDFPSIVEVYNSEGKKEANRLIREKYGVKHPYFIYERIKKSGIFAYDEQNDCFVTAGADPDESLFMSIDELCGVPPKPATGTGDDSKQPQTNSMDALIHTLISDRLLELSRYVTLDVERRTIMIDQTGMRSDGYNVVTR